MKKALVIIDVQNDYFPGGNCELSQPEQALIVVKQLLNYFRENQLPVYFVRHKSDADAAFFVPGTKGVEIHPGILPRSSEKVIEKHMPNGFYGTSLKTELDRNSINDLVICGMMTHMCIDTTVRASKDLGYSVTLISDACATKDLEYNGVYMDAATVQNVYLASLDTKFAAVMTGEQFIKLDS